MATYYDLGPTLPLLAVADINNVYGPGNYTITATKRDMGNLPALCEVYQISIDGPVGSSFKLYRGTRIWNTVNQGWSNNYDPVNPLFVRPADELRFYWNVAPPATPVPTATLWLRFDADVEANKPYVGRG